MIFRDLKKQRKNITERNPGIVKKCEKYLEAGVYITGHNTNEIILRNKSQKKVLTFSDLEEKESYFIRKLKKKWQYSVSCGENQKYYGSKILISSSGKEIKIFDYRKNCVLTIFDEKQKCADVMNRKEKFTGIYRTVPGTRTGDRQICDQLIQAKEFDNDQMIAFLVGGMQGMLQAMGIQKKEVQKEYRDFCEKFHIRGCWNPETVPCTLTHGDFWRENIISDGEVLYLIDFEHAAERYFMYDFFMCLFASAYYYNDWELIKRYFDGKFEEKLRKIYGLAEIEYESERKYDYFLLFFSQIYEERWKKIKGTSMDVRLFVFLKKMKSYR